MSGAVVATVGYSEEWYIQIVKSIVLFLIAVQIVPVVLLAERKLLGRFQHRYGPNRVGPFGMAQPLADIIKLATKEPFRPSTSVGFLYALAPVISLLTALAAFAILPFGDVANIFGTDVGLYGLDVGIGVLYVFAFGAIAFYGLMLGGWASGSKYSFLGSMRAAAQLISYEVAMGLSLVGVLMTAGTLSLTGIVEAQTGMWYVVPQFVGFLIFITDRSSPRTSSPST
jgi:NADH-quinone oxidoreductase subunit H